MSNPADMTRLLLSLFLVGCMSVAVAGPAPVPAQSDPATEPAEDEIQQPSAPRSDLRRSRLTQGVDRAISKAVKFLISRQNEDGSWTVDGEPNDYTVGTTALVTLSLLSAGESHQSDPLVRAIKYLKSVRPDKSSKATYSVALRAAVYAQLPPSVRDRELKLDMAWLQRALITDGPMRGMYGYGDRDGANAWADYSNSQYGVLGVWYGAMAGIEVPLAYWKRVELAWREGQHADGGWGYRPTMHRSYASMTAAGAATLYITQDYLHSSESENLSRPSENKPLEAAIKWLGDNFAVDHNPGIDTRLDGNRAKNLEDQLLDDLLPLVKPKATWLHYLLFGYERVGEASGLTRFGRRKWFDEGATYLIRTQKYDGSWEADMGTEIDTAYALLFLARGRAPVVVQKLQFEGRWNNRSRDIAGFIGFMRRASERHINWQIVSIDSTPGELREAPILYIASDKALKLSIEQKQRLKTYIDQGGMLLCVNEGTSDAFALSVVLEANQMFPQYKFRDLPQDHPIYTANFPTSGWDAPIRGLSNGIRELIILVPSGDASAKWQTAGGAFDVKRTAYAPLANLLLYVTDKANPRYKGEDAWVERNDAVKPAHTVRVGRLKYAGNWDPEPGGWARLSNVLYNFDQAQLLIAITAPEQINPQCSLVHLCAIGTFELSKPQVDGLREYLSRGGLLVLDAAGGSPDAALAFEALLKSLYPEVTIQPLPLDHPIYRAEPFGGQTIEEVTYRRSPDRPNTKLPRLKGALVQDKLVAIVSNEDLSAGFVAYQTSGPIGYTTQSATDLMRNIILWSAGRESR